MKTVLVIYTSRKITGKEIDSFKRYAFNTEADISVGDMIESEDYGNKMQVVKILNNSYKYYNKNTGELSDEFTSSMQYDIKELKLETEKEENVVYFKVTDKQKKAVSTEDFDNFIEKKIEEKLKSANTVTEQS